MHRGETFHWDVFSDVATQGGTLVETATMPETNFTITQGTLTITEYGNSVPYTGKLDNLSYLPVKEVVQKALKNDAKKALDSAAATQFNASKLRVVASDGTDTAAVVLTTDGTASVTNNVALGKEHVKNIIDTMKDRNIAPFMGDDYGAIAIPSTLRTFKNDLESIHQYVETGFAMILAGEIGRYEGCRFFEQTNISAGTVSTAGSAWTNSKSDFVAFFGEDTVAEAMAIPEEVRGKLPGDYGRSRGVAWYYLGGFGIIHTTEADSRIVIWDSAA